MTPIHQEIIPKPMAWSGSDFQSKEDVSFYLTDEHRAALEELLVKLRDVPVESITFEQCRHPALDVDLDRVLDEVQSGRGLVLLRGVPVQGRTVEENSRLNWIINTHFGKALSQNCLGHRITYVQEERLKDGRQATRGHKSSADLAMHTDNAEVFTLLCVRTAKEGGATQFTNALEIHNDLLRNRPEVLPILYKGFPHHRRGDQPEGHEAVTPYDVPIFSNVDGHVSIVLVIGSILAGLAERDGREPNEQEQAALDALHESAMRLSFELGYVPGDMSVVNNLTHLHSRTAYQDWDEPDRRRLLIRTWLQARRDRRPVVPETKVYVNEGGAFGADPVPGREHDRNETVGVSEYALSLVRAGQVRRFEQKTAERTQKVDA